MRHVKRRTELARTWKCASHMIAVFVGNQNGIDVIRLQTQPGKPLCQIAWAEATVEQHPCTASLDNKGVALAAAAQGCEAHALLQLLMKQHQNLA
jgi:hypothetical protein